MQVHMEKYLCAKKTILQVKANNSILQNCHPITFSFVELCILHAFILFLKLFSIQLK